MTSCKHALLLLALMAPLILTTHAAVTITWTLQGTTATGVSTTSYPGARYGATTWVDSTGRLWMFSGVGKENSTVEGYLNQLYQYNAGTNVWSLTSGTVNTNGAGSYPQSVGGAGSPGGRYGTARWADASGNLFLFGGQGIGSVAGAEGILNDFWQYSTITSQWVFLGGQITVNAAGSASVTTFPSPRVGASYWTDKQGNFYLFGGKGYTSGTSTTALLNDLWVYRPANSAWTQVTTSAQPAGRAFATCWTDGDGNGWIYGGSDLSGTYYSDLWQYRNSTNAWTNRAGSTSTNQNPVFPTSTVSGNPGGLYAASGWHSRGQFYMFGGYGLTSQSTFSSNRDLWSFNGNTSAWTYVYGTSGTVTGSLTNPGARYSSALWKDNSENVVVFGGNGYDSTGLSTSGILGDTRVILACVFTSSCLLTANDTTTSASNATTSTGGLTSTTAKSTSTGALTSSTTGSAPVTTTTATVNLTLSMSGDPAKVNTSALGGSVAASLNISASQVNTTIVLSKKKDVLVNFKVIITVFFPNSSAISAATGGAGAGNITQQLAVLTNVVTAAANSTAVNNVLKSGNLTVTGVTASATSAVVVVPTTGGGSTTAAAASSSTTYSAAFTLSPPMGPLAQVMYAFVACVLTLFLCTN